MLLKETLQPSLTVCCLFDLPLAGRAHVVAEEAIGNYTGFELTAVHEGNSTTARVAAGVRCPGCETWFMAAPPPICPTDPPLHSQAAAQSFERGEMIWLEATDTFYIFYDTDLRLAPGGAGRSTLKSLRIVQGPLQLEPGASPDNRVADTPPPGFFEPVSGFGLLWRGEVAAMDGVRAQLGWATAAEYGFSGRYQCARHCGSSWSCYLLGPGEQLFHLYYLLHFGHYWKEK